MGVRNDSNVHDICNIQDLLGSTGSKVTSRLVSIRFRFFLINCNVQVLVGFLTQPRDGVWHLEDLTSTIAIDFSHAKVFIVKCLTTSYFVIYFRRLMIFSTRRAPLLLFKENSSTLNCFESIFSAILQQRRDRLLSMQSV